MKQQWLTLRKRWSGSQFRRHWGLRNIRFKLFTGFASMSLATVGLFFVAVMVVLGMRYKEYMSGDLSDYVPIEQQVERAYEQNGWHSDMDRSIDFTHSLELSEVFVYDLDGNLRMPINGDVSAYMWLEKLLMHETTLTVDGEPFGVMVTMPLSAEFRYYFLPIMLVSALGALGLAVLLTRFASYLLLKPIEALTQAANEIAVGDVATPVRVVSENSADEIAQLAIAFNRMNKEVNQSREMRKQLTADIAHDIRSPLGLIAGHAEGLRDGVLSADDDAFDIIYDEAMRISRLVEDLSTLSKAESGILTLTMEKTSPHVLLDRVVTAHATIARERDIALEQIAVDPLPDVNVDRDRIAQVLDNLVTNALRYTPPGGWVRLVAAVNHAADTLQITVEDNGSGITEKDLPHIFERFYRGDKSRNSHLGGSGLGLAITKWIVEAHDGQISASSPPGKGATFLIELPL